MNRLCKLRIEGLGERMSLTLLATSLLSVGFFISCAARAEASGRQTAVSLNAKISYANNDTTNIEISWKGQENSSLLVLSFEPADVSTDLDEQIAFEPPGQIQLYGSQIAIRAIEESGTVSLATSSEALSGLFKNNDFTLKVYISSQVGVVGWKRADRMKGGRVVTSKNMSSSNVSEVFVVPSIDEKPALSKLFPDFQPLFLEGTEQEYLTCATNMRYCTAFLEIDVKSE